MTLNWMVKMAEIDWEKVNDFENWDIVEIVLPKESDS